MGRASAERPEAKRIEQHIQRDQSVLGHMNNHVVIDGVRGRDRQREKEEGTAPQRVLDAGMLHRIRWEADSRSDVVKRCPTEASL